MAPENNFKSYIYIYIKGLFDQRRYQFQYQCCKSVRFSDEAKGPSHILSLPRQRDVSLFGGKAHSKQTVTKQWSLLVWLVSIGKQPRYGWKIEKGDGDTQAVYGDGFSISGSFSFNKFYRIYLPKIIYTNLLPNKPLMQGGIKIHPKTNQ